MTCSKMASLALRHFPTSAGLRKRSARLSPWSKATQHITRLYVKSWRPPRVSQMPSSGRSQWSASQSSVLANAFHPRYVVCCAISRPWDTAVRASP